MPLQHRMNRRDFVRTASSGFVLAPFADVAALAQLTAQRSRVALVHSSDRKRGVAQALRLLDFRAVDSKRVVLKPNFNSADDPPASTHNDTLAQIVGELRERGARSVTLGESSGPPQTHGVMERKGIFDLASDLKFDVVDFE